MSPAPARTVLIVSGPGLSEPAELAASLRSRSFTVKTAALSFEGEPTPIVEFADAHVIVVRGPATASVEEKLYARLLALRLKPSFDILQKRFALPNPPKLIAVGRGALAYSLSGVVPEEQIEANFSWESILADEGPWIQLTINDEVFYGLVQSRLVPIVRAPEKIDFKPIVRFNGTAVVWSHRGSALLAFVDVLACAERNQLLNFGYEDLLKVRTQAEIFELLLK